MVRRTFEEAQQTRASILRSAEIVFARRGVAQSSLEDVAAHAGVTRGAVYWHFKGKQQLLREMLDRYRLPLEQLEPGQTLAEECQALVAALLRTVHQPKSRRVVRLLLQRTEWSAGHEDVHRRAMDARLSFTRHMTGMVERAMARDELSPRIDPAQVDSLVLALRGGVGGFLLEMLRFPRLTKRSDIEAGIYELLRRLLGPAALGTDREAPSAGPTKKSAPG